MVGCPWEPDFSKLAAVLERGKPDRPVLFELFIDDSLIKTVTGVSWPVNDWVKRDTAYIKANEILGHDYAVVTGSGLNFPKGQREGRRTVSLNDGALINDRDDFNNYPWPDPDKFSTERLDKLAEALPGGMELMIWPPDGLFELVVGLTGYENLCYMLYDDMPLAEDLFAEAGKRYLRYFELCLRHRRVSAVVSSDDWGFKTGTMLSAEHFRKLVFPWHRELARLAHESGRYAILHTCGNTDEIMDDIIDMGYDAKHSFEDEIWPIEDAYSDLHGKIGVLGGIDVDFLARGDIGEIIERTDRLLELSDCRGGYALGSGNSIPEYVPVPNFFAMTEAAYRHL